MSKLEFVNLINKEGHVTGGYVYGEGVDIKWQDGPIIDNEPNGALVEDILLAVLKRLQAYNDTDLRNREASLAITKIEEALHWLGARRKDREERGVLNTYNP